MNTATEDREKKKNPDFFIPGSLALPRSLGQGLSSLQVLGEASSLYNTRWYHLGPHVMPCNTLTAEVLTLKIFHSDFA